MTGADQPVLAGLQAMAERALRQRERATRIRPVRDAAAPLHPAGFAFLTLYRRPA